MTENEPQPEPQPSPWARGSAGREDAGHRQQGAGGPDTGGHGVGQGDPVPPGGAQGVSQGDAVPPRTGEADAPQGSATPPVTDARGASQGSAAPSEYGVAGAPQGSAAPPVSGMPGASQGSAASSGVGVPGAPQGSPGTPDTGSSGAWFPGAARPEDGWGGAHQGVHQGAHQGAHQPPPGPYYAAPGQAPAAPRAKGRGKLLAGVTALVLAVGGVAGGLGGYVGYQAAERSAPVTNALNAPPPAQRTGDAPAGSTEQVAQKVLPTVVQVQVSGGAGSGFVLSSDGLVLTNNHVVETAANGGAIKVQFQDGRSASARIIGRDPSSDLAVVRAEGVSGLPTAELGNSGDLRIGQQVVAVGSPFDLNGTVTSGIVSSLNRPVRAGGEGGSQATVLNAIQTDAAINPGNSGGPLVNMQGQVVGINSAIYSPNRTQSSQGGSVGIGFAIPIDQARRTATELSETGRATQTVLGVQVTDGPDGGAQVREVTPGGAAEQSGLRTGDVITKFGDRPIDSSDALVAAVRSRAPGERVQLTVGGSRTVDVTLGSQPVEVK